MSVFKKKWKQKDGSVVIAWQVDIRKKLPGRPTIRVTQLFKRRRDAEAFDRNTLSAIINRTYRTEKEIEAEETTKIAEAQKNRVKTLADFQEAFLKHSELLSKNKHSTLVSKKQILRDHLVPAFGHLALDQITEVEIDAYIALSGTPSASTAWSSLRAGSPGQDSARK